MIKRNEVWIKAAAQLKETTDKIAYLKQVKDEQSKILQELSEFRDSSGGGYEFKEINRIGTIQYKNIPELKDLDLSAYRAEDSSFWKLNFKKQFKEIVQDEVVEYSSVEDLVNKVLQEFLCQTT